MMANIIENRINQAYTAYIGNSLSRLTRNCTVCEHFTGFINESPNLMNELGLKSSMEEFMSDSQG